jgi:tripartite-type tricarboxylate transporter receptor subunit TctC
MRSIGYGWGAALVLAAFATLCFARPAAAAYPERTIRLVVAYPAGGTGDLVGRIVADALSARLGVSVVVENQSGASGAIAAATVARAPPDGHTILLGGNAIFAILPHVTKVSYDGVKDFTAIANLSESLRVLAVSPAVPAKTLPEFVDHARRVSGKLNFGSAGIGTAPHLAGELVKLRAGIEMTHVPYRGIGAAYPDIMSGKVQLGFSSIAGAVPFTSDNRVKAIATTGAKRSTVYPDVPTVAEGGLAGFDVDLWTGVLAPAGMPPAVLAKLNSEIAKALQHPEMKAALDKIGVEPRGTPADQAAAFTQAEYEKWKKVIVDGKIKL